MQVGNKVKIIYGEFKGQVGEIHSITTNKFGDALIYIVKISKNEMVKVFADSVELVKEENPDTITINRDEFKTAVVETIDSLIKEDKLDPRMSTVLMLNGIVIGSQLERVLFND